MREKLCLFICLLVVLQFASCVVRKADLGDTDAPAATIIVLGSSTAAGTGPSDIDNAWVNRYLIYAEGVDPHHRIINLAKGAYTTYHIMPRGFVPPEGRPKPDASRSITMALSLAPAAVIINLPSNDAAYGYSVDEQLANYDSILAVAQEEHVPVWVTTTQPRNLSAEKRRNLMAMRDSTFSRLGQRALDFWTDLAGADGTIESAYDCGDGVHLNDEGHGVLYRRIVAAGVLDSAVAQLSRRASSP